ncbi:MAG: ferredoxin [Elainellaceae cyanobacterium]
MDSSLQAKPKRRCVLVCQNRSCLRAGSDHVLAAFRAQTSLPVTAMESGCVSQCSVGPNVRVMPDGTSYCRVKSDDVSIIVAEHLEGDRPVQSLFHPRMHGYAHLGQVASQTQHSPQPCDTKGE